MHSLLCEAMKVKLKWTDPGWKKIFKIYCHHLTLRPQVGCVCCQMMLLFFLKKQQKTKQDHILKKVPGPLSHSCFKSSQNRAA